MIKSYEITVERFGHETTYTHVKSIGKSVELAKNATNSIHELHRARTLLQEFIVILPAHVQLFIKRRIKHAELLFNQSIR